MLGFLFAFSFGFWLNQPHVQKEESKPVAIAPFFAWIPVITAILTVAVLEFVKSCSHQVGNHAGNTIGNVVFP